MSVKIGHASCDEYGRASGGTAGDQTGREVCTRSWYKGGWNVVLRAKRAAVAEAMARTCEILCRSNLVGYDQYQRNTLRAELRRLDWDASRLATPCETDCSALMTVCAEAAGVNVAYTKTSAGSENAPVTQNMRQRFFATGEFEVLLDRKYTDSDDCLLRGDVLVRESGHTAMALSNGAKAAPRDESASSPLGGGSGNNGETEASSPFGGGSGNNKEEEMDISKLTDEECWQIIEKAQRYAAALPAPAWSRPELTDAKESGITDGTRPAALVTRCEAAIMALRAREPQGESRP